MAVSEAQKDATNKWLSEHYTNKNVKLNMKLDKDILDHLKKMNEEGTSTNAYLKQLIRKDIKERQEK